MEVDNILKKLKEKSTEAKANPNVAIVKEKQLTNVEVIVRQNCLSHADAWLLTIEKNNSPSDVKKKYFEIAEELERWVWRPPQ